MVKGEDTLLGCPVEVEADLVVLATAMVPAGYEKVAKLAGIPWIKTAGSRSPSSSGRWKPLRRGSSGGACQDRRIFPIRSARPALLL